MKYLVVYDIAEDRVRTRIAEAIDDFGVRVQESVFECELSADALARLQARLTEFVGGSAAGSVRIYQLCDRCAGNVVSLESGGTRRMQEGWMII